MSPHSFYKTLDMLCVLFDSNETRRVKKSIIEKGFEHFSKKIYDNGITEYLEKFPFHVLNYKLFELKYNNRIGVCTPNNIFLNKKYVAKEPYFMGGLVLFHERVHKQIRQKYILPYLLEETLVARAMVFALEGFNLPPQKIVIALKESSLNKNFFNYGSEFFDILNYLLQRDTNGIDGLFVPKHIDDLLK